MAKYMTEETPLVDRFLRIKEVRERTGLSTATIYRQIKSKKFPGGVLIGTQAKGWLESEVNKWVNDCVLSGRNPQ